MPIEHWTYKERMNEPLTGISPENAHNAALALASVAVQKQDPCGLSVALDALSLKEMLQEDKTS